MGSRFLLVLIAGAALIAPARGIAQTSAAADSLISYSVEPTPADLERTFTAEQIALLEKLNRADREHLPRLRKLVIPDRWSAADLAYSPFPREVVQLESHRKALIVDQPLQVFGAYENGRLVRWGPVSSGREEHPTPTGKFNLNWRSRGRHSTVDPDWYMEWYFNFHNERGLALHQFALPGRPASHACVRLLERHARWLYRWGEGWQLGERGWDVVAPGTPFWIQGRYTFDAPPPWLAELAPHPPVEVRLP